MAPLARWCFTHRFPVLALWIAGLIVLAGLSHAAGDQYSDSFSLPGTASTRALELLQKSFTAQSGDSDQIVFHTGQGTVKDPATRQRLEAMLAKVAKGPHVVSVVSPFAPAGGAGQPGRPHRLCDGEHGQAAAGHPEGGLRQADRDGAGGAGARAAGGARG